MIDRLRDKRIIYIALSAVAGLIIAVTFKLMLSKPEYEANTSYYVSVFLMDSEKELGYNEYLASSELARSFLLYLSDTYMYKNAAKNLPEGLSKEYNYRDLQRMIKVKLMEDTFIIKFTVTSDNKNDAVLLCNYYSGFSLEEVKKLLGLGYT